MVTSMGAETLPFLSAFGVLPASLAFFVVYNKLVAKLPPRLVFAAAVTPLAAFYVLFATVIYPAADVLHPYGATAWVRALPRRTQPQTGNRGCQQACCHPQHADSNSPEKRVKLSWQRQVTACFGVAQRLCPWHQPAGHKLSRVEASKCSARAPSLRV